MSTKTNFKRIALVAVAALGLGVLSSVPSQAQVLTSVTVTAVNGTGTTATTDSSTAGTAALAFTSTAGAGVGFGDSVVIQAVMKSSPTGAATIVPTLMVEDTGVAAQYTYIDSDLGKGSNAFAANGLRKFDSAVVTSSTAVSQLIVHRLDTTVSGSALANFKVYLDTSVTGSAVALTAGTYVISVITTPYDNGVATLANTKFTDVSIVISAIASNSKVASASTSTAYIGATQAAATAASSDSVVTALATASTTLRASIAVKLRNASNGNAASESLTVTTTIGSLGVGVASGKSLTLPYTTGGSDTATFIDVYADGTAGTAVITIKSSTVTFANKTVTFYASAPTTLVAKAINTSPGTGSTTAIAVDAKDANGNRFAGTLYTYSSVAATIANDGTSTYACSYVTANDRHECSVTGSVAGTATITVRDAATVALSTVSSNAVSLTVTVGVPATVKLSFDKSTYAPGEKATLLISVLDAAGKSVSARTLTNLFATGGITSNVAFGNASETTTAVSITTASLQAADPTLAQTDPVKAYTIYMPATGGTMKVTATGSTSLPLAGQVAVSATATVTDSATAAVTAATAALAAVAALATTVASLKTLITTLTNLVLKIQKKVKA